jgi:hypothetical protein
MPRCQAALEKTMLAKRVLRFTAHALSMCLAVAILCDPAEGATTRRPRLIDAQHTLSSINVAGVRHNVHQWRFGPRPNDDDDELIIIAIEIPSGKYALRVLDIQRDGVIQDLLKAANCKNPIFLTNGGFYAQMPDGLRKPEGLAIVDGAEASAFKSRRCGGFLTSNGNDVNVVGVQLPNVARLYKHVIQSCPVIIRSRRNDIRSDDGILFNRIAIGRTRSGGLIVVGAFREDGDALSLYQMADLIVEMGKSGGPIADDMLALDGGPSANLVIPQLDLSFGYTSASYLPNGICVSGKE